MNDGEFSHMAERRARRRRREEQARMNAVDYRDACDSCGAPEITYTYQEYPGAKWWTETTIQHVAGCENE
jgi:hypothetical protein